MASLLVSIIVDKSKKYKKVLIVLNITGVLVMAVGTTLLEVLSERYALIVAFVLYTITVSSIIPIYTTAMDYVCELTYPVGESISEGLTLSAISTSAISASMLLAVVFFGSVTFPIVCTTFLKDHLSFHYPLDMKFNFWRELFSFL